MAKARTSFVCRSCGAVQPRWMGKCPDCGTWDGLEKVTVAATTAGLAGELDATGGWLADAASSAGGAGLPDAADGIVELATGDTDSSAAAQPLAAVQLDDVQRLPSGLAELDRVLGGGLVPGSVVLLGGDPGIGKSTLLLQAAAGIASGSALGWVAPSAEDAAQHPAAPAAGAQNSVGPSQGRPRAEPRRILYVSSEESARQIRLRAERLDAGLPHGGADDSGRVLTSTSELAPELGGSPDGRRSGGDAAAAETSAKHRRMELGERLYVLSETNLSRIVEQARRVRPAVLVVDSLQMVYRPGIEASPGSVTQLRRCCIELVHLAKRTGAVVLIVGHVTKDGQLAGPRLIEHLVDVVLSFEGDRHHAHRIVRAIKNRFGDTMEIGLFEMTGGGLREVADPGSVIDPRSPPGPGSVICPTMHGTRCLLAEVQALTATGILGAARRKASGIDPGRLAMLVAVLEKHGGLRLADQDIFVAAVGGLRLVEPAADLAIAMAIGGVHLGRAVESGIAVIGEVALSGQIRPVGNLAQRVREARRRGFERILVPRTGAECLGAQQGVEAVDRLSEALDTLSVAPIHRKN